MLGAGPEAAAAVVDLFEKLGVRAMTAVLVLVETDDDGGTEVSREALTFARDARRRCTHAGRRRRPGRPRRRSSGRTASPRVHHADGEAFTSYAAAAWAAAVVAAAADVSVVDRGRDRRGNEVLAHVACRLGTAMAANVVAVDGADPLVVSRQVARRRGPRADAADRRGRGVLGRRPRLRAAPGRRAHPPEVTPLDVAVTESDLRARVVRTEPGEPDESGSLKSARVVVGAGRGAGGPDGFKDLIELTDLLGGALGVSRVVTSLGWRPHHEQVGQTGSRISPDLYVACGISGAIQHWAGLCRARRRSSRSTPTRTPRW